MMSSSLRQQHGKSIGVLISAYMLTVYMVAHIHWGDKGAKQGLNRGLLGVSSVFHDPSVHDISSPGRHEDDIGATLGDIRATQGDIYA